MSLEIIQYDTSNCSESNLLTIIKQRTGLELTSIGNPSSGIEAFDVRFPDMETTQSIKLQYFNASGTIFIDADNHFLCYSIASGTERYGYVDTLYKALVVDFNGKLASVCHSKDIVWTSTMNTASLDGNYQYYNEDDSSKSNITLCPLRVKAYNDLNDAGTVKTFVKNCYVNYERKFQKNLKFIDQNGNKFVTLGGYLLYKVD